MYLELLFCCAWTSAALGASLNTGQTSSSSNNTAGYKFGTPYINATYDYVIIGGGTAGLTLATRLAEDSSLSIAVVEAGGFYEADAGNISTTPAYDIFFSGTSPNDTNPKIDWGFVTEPQAGANGRKLHYARGKTLGGSSARNFLLYHRPTISSMQRWADEVGDLSYTFANLLPFFKKSVHYTPPFPIYQNSTNSQDNNAFSSAGGPLQVSFGKYEDPYGTWAQRTFQALGQVAINGFQAGRLLGSAYMALTEDPITGQRSSSESSFLQSSRSLNLHIYNNTLAQRICFSGNNTATGVLVSSSSPIPPNVRLASTTYTLHARREVILSAGAFQSPQLLMVSGIGPRSLLAQHSIPVLHDLPGVGQNLQDQPFFGTSHRVSLSTASAGLNNATLNAQAISAFQSLGAGPLTNPAIPVIGWENLPNATLSRLSPATQAALRTFPADWPHLEFLPVGTLLNTPNFALGDPIDGSNYASVATALIAPLSRGNVSISSASMADPPLINPAWLTSPGDREVAIAAFKRQREYWTYLSAHNVAIGEEVRPGPAVQTEEQIMRYIKDSVSPIWHAAATCKMGKASDAGAVVDGRGRVFGTRGLRVVDASAMPFLPPGHPQSVVYAVAEKIAEEIKMGR